jgi:hypothetical protein
MDGMIEDSRTSKGYRSTVFKCAQDHMAYYCEGGTKRSIFYDGAGGRDMQINLLFEHKADAFALQNTLVNFRFVHPTFGNKIHIEENVDKSLSHSLLPECSIRTALELTITSLLP